MDKNQNYLFLGGNIMRKFMKKRIQDYNMWDVIKYYGFIGAVVGVFYGGYLIKEKHDAKLRKRKQVEI